MPTYCPEPLAGVPLYPVFNFLFPKAISTIGPYDERLLPNFFQKKVICVPIEDARAIILPNNFTYINADIEKYIAQYTQEAETLGIPLFIFSCGDFTDKLQFDSQAHVFLLSTYRSSPNNRNIVIPAIIEDLSKGGITIRKKTQEPMISFCGQAGYKTIKQWIKYYIKVMSRSLISPIQHGSRARMIGIYWRRQVLAACRNSSILKTNFIIRRSYSGARSTIELDPTQARAEFTQSIVNADFVLAPKGDGNYSYRFFEVLALGRIPVVVDTDIVLPFEDIIDYEKIVVRVPMCDVHNTPRYIRKFYDALSPEEWEARQRLASTIFEQYLRQDSFFERFFARAHYVRQFVMSPNP